MDQPPHLDQAPRLDQALRLDQAPEHGPHQAAGEADDAILRLSIDLGSSTTRVMGGGTGADRPTAFPTVFAPGTEAHRFILGTQSLGAAAPVWPLEQGVVSSEDHCLTYLRILRESMAPDAKEVWAVLSAPSAGRDKEPQRLARIAGIAFDRALVVPALTLASLRLLHLRSTFPNKATLLDLGASCLQAALIQGQWPEPKEIIHLSAGGAAYDLRLTRLLRAQFPDVGVDTFQARRLKERYAHASQSPTTCLVQVVHRGHRRIVDIGETLFECYSPLVDSLTESVAFILGTPSGSKAREYGSEVILVGGGARTAGIDRALLNALRARGYATERVTIPERPAELVVRGGWHIARTVKSAHWEVLNTK